MQYLQHLTKQEVNALTKLSTQLGINFETLICLVSGEIEDLHNTLELSVESIA